MKVWRERAADVFADQCAIAAKKKFASGAGTTDFFIEVGWEICHFLPAFCYTAEAPFDAEGKRIESVWKNADTCVRFVEIVPSATAASLPSLHHSYFANGIRFEPLHSLIFGWGGSGGDEGLRGCRRIPPKCAKARFTRISRGLASQT